VLPTVGSTNDHVRALALAGHLPGLTVLAEEQTAGRGRQGRTWISPPGVGVWMTVLLPAGLGSGVLTLGAAVAVRQAVIRTTGFAPALKWPNDLVVGQAKLCGILGEGLGEHGVALGIGLNVHAPSTAPPDFAATHVDRELGRPVTFRHRLAAAILNELETVTEALAAGRSAQILAAWREGCDHLGRMVTIAMGPQTEVGRAIDVDDAGALILERSDGSRATVWSGTLRVIPAGDSPETRAHSS
jgi:BirA family transcriptional regulator, biotin operon repressor / biotin---[acetyl-CoA-carboxylase] ligase